jgi:predicted lipid-binding transport protein (Tim44 family)
MKALFGVVSLLLVLGIVSLLVKKQLPANDTHSQQQPSQQLPQQVKQQVEAAMQPVRPIPDDK